MLASHRRHGGLPEGWYRGQLTEQNGVRVRLVIHPQSDAAGKWLSQLVVLVGATATTTATACNAATTSYCSKVDGQPAVEFCVYARSRVVVVAGVA